MTRRVAWSDGDRTLAEDATQEALLRVVTHLSEFRGEARRSTWATCLPFDVAHRRIELPDADHFFFEDSLAAMGPAIEAFVAR